MPAWECQCGNQTIECAQDRGDAGNGIGCGIDTDNGVPATIKQAVKRREQNPANVIGRMVGLQANAENTAFAHGVSASRDVADL